MSFKRTKKGLSSLILLTFLLFGCFFDLNGQSCYIPTNVVTNNITPTTATLQWDAMPNATAYEVNYRPMNAPSTQPWNTVSAPTNTATINALTPSTMYDVQIRSACGSDFSDYTVTTSFSTQNCVPPMNPIVSNLTANSADIQWTAVPGASGYQLLHRIAVSDGNPGAWNATTVTGNSYNLTGLVSNTLYAGRLVTDCGGVPSDNSKEFYFSTNPCSVPANLLITAQTASSVSLSWDVVPSASQYNVQYRTAGNGTWISVNTNTNSRTINGLTGNTAYEFRVRSNCGVTSAYTLISKGFTLPCAMPENAIISNVTVNSATVSWNNAVGATQYKVEYREAFSPTWTTVNASATVKNITGLTPDTDYEVRVRTKCSGNQYSAYTDTLKFRTKKCYTPRPPRLVDVDVNSARIEWNSSVNVTRYQLDYKTGSNTWTTITTTDTFRVLNNLLQNESYEVRLRSQCATGVYSDYPDTIYVVVSPCVPPSNFQLDQVSYTSATFHWDTTDYATRYRLEYKRQNDTFWQSQLVNGTTTTLNGLDHGTVYQAQISSRCGNNLFSPIGRIIRFRTEICEIPFNLIIDTVGYTTIDMRWLDVNAPHYEVHYKLLSDVNWTVRQANNSSVRLNQLLSGASYEIKVRARCVPNAFSGFSPPIIIKTNPCRTPFNLRVDTIPPNRLRFSWSPVNGRNNGYEVSYRGENDSTYTTRNTQDTFIVLNLDTARHWQFRVRTRCGNGLFSDYAIYLNPSVDVGCDIRNNPASIVVNRCSGSSNLPSIFLQGGDFWAGGTWTLTSCSTGQVIATDQVFGKIDTPQERILVQGTNIIQAAFFDNRTGPHIICFSGNNTGGRPNCVVCDTICLIPAPNGDPRNPSPVTITSQSLGCTLGYDLTVNGLCLGGQCMGNNLPFIQWTVNGTVIGSTRTIRVNPTVRTTYQVRVNQYGCPSTATITLDPNTGLPIDKQCDGDICFGATYRAVFSYLGQSGETDVNVSLNGLPYYGFSYESQQAGTQWDHRFSVQLRPNTSSQPGYVVGRNVIYFGRYDIDFTCYGADSCVFFVHPALSATITATPGITIPQGGNVTLSTTVTGGQPPYTYSWSPINYDDGIIDPANGPSANITNLRTRTEFCVEIRDAIGCVTDVCQVINIEECPSACCSLVVEDRNDLCRRNQFRLCVTGGEGPYDAYDWEFPWLENITTTTTPCIDINIPPNFIGSNRQISVIAIRAGEPTSCRTAIQIREIGHDEFPGSKVCTVATS